ncbi:MAG: hypothetical protein E3J56_06190 [Candidatus Aminicenantes bacterium]|nr:MAG: hypothetical protein E3J56_06190 [Candidatus Aminicenantes bacterium]
MVQILDPSEDDMVCDPACGSAGFLIMVLDHVRQKIAKELSPKEKDILLHDRANNDPKVIRKRKSVKRDLKSDNHSLKTFHAHTFNPKEADRCPFAGHRPS